jgi:guanylate kinase
MTRCFTVSGPSGVGKGTLCQALMAKHAKALGLALSVSMTTRPPRPGEIEGEHYYFVSRPAFERHIREGDMLEWAEYNGSPSS